MKIALVSVPVENPIEAHNIYTTRLGFVSRQFEPEANLAIVVSKEDPSGTAVLLEPCSGNFAQNYQRAAFSANLPIMALGADNPAEELNKLKAAGVILRPELDNPQWGIQNVFEDGCGNLLMIEKTSD